MDYMATMFWRFLSSQCRWQHGMQLLLLILSNDIHIYNPPKPRACTSTSSCFSSSMTVTVTSRRMGLWKLPSQGFSVPTTSSQGSHEYNIPSNHESKIIPMFKHPMACFATQPVTCQNDLAFIISLRHAGSSQNYSNRWPFCTICNLDLAATM